MKRKQNYFKVVLAFIAVSFLTFSCSDGVNVIDDDDNGGIISSSPSITSVTATCFYNSEVVINGNNFSPNKEDNIVKFGTEEATVTKATKTSLTVTTPDLGAAATANITVTVSDKV